MSLTHACLGPAPGKPCPYHAFTTGTRCPLCKPAYNRDREQRRGNRHERGYGTDHTNARASLAATLPAPCGYCRRPVTPDMRWVAAHVIDGDPSYGWMVAHADCNERAKQRG